MNIQTIVNRVNRKLAGEIETLEEIRDYLDDVIDMINTELNTIFPAFSELVDGTVEYDFFPDRYVRSVLIPGAAFYYYQADEEGINASPGYENEFNKGLFFMKRDYSSSIPEEYQASSKQGSITFEVEEVTGVRGLEVDGSIWNL